MEGCDLQLWHIEAFIEYIHTYDDTRLALVELAARRLGLRLRYPAVKHYWIELAERLIDRKYLCSPYMRGYACHSDVQAGGIGVQLLDDFGNDVAIGSGVIEGIHRTESDSPGIALSLRLPHGIDVDNPSV